MHRARVELVGLFVAIFEVAATTTFVSEAPEDDRRMVAVAEHHALNAVNESRNPRFATRDALVGVVFEVGLIHHVESVVVKHGIHAGVLRIV